MSYREILQAELERIGLSAPQEIQERLAGYSDELERWNRTVNLTALRGVDLVRRLIVEPIWVGQQLQMSGVLADVGSGNGSPGIPIGLTRPFSGVHLIEARARRAAFLRHMKMRLGLTEVSVHKSRLEDTNALGPLDWITFQAVAATRELLAALRPLASQTTRVVWITSRQEPPVPADEHLTVPGSGAEVWTFHVDHS